MTRELSNKFRNMALICAMLVVFIHTPCHSSDWTVQGFRWIFSFGLAKIAVPFFFVSAGFFLAKHFDEDGWYGSAVRSRVKTLLIPLLLWNVISFVHGGVMRALANVFTGHPLLEYGAFHLDAVEALRILALWPFSQPYHGVLWFVRVLFLLVLVSPGVRKLASLKMIVVLYLLNGLVCPDYGVECTPLHFTFHEGFCSLFGLLYFTLGVYLQANQRVLHLSKRVGISLFVVGLVVLVFRGTPHVSLCSRLMTWLAVPFLLAGTWSFVPESEPPQWLAFKSFPIYMLHGLILGDIDKFMVKVDVGLIGYVGMALTAIAASVILVEVARKVAPKATGLLMGGRV